MRNVAEIMVQQMEQVGIRRLYAVIGDSLNYLGEAVSKSKIEWIAMRNEEVGAFAAAGEAFMSGKICACAGTCGPGSIHLINGLYEANANRVPLLAIVTHIPTNQIGLEYFQNNNPMLLFRDCSVFCEMLANISQMPRLFQAAMQTAIAKKAVAVIIVPGDIIQASCPESALMHQIIVQNPLLVPNLENIAKVAEMINDEKKVTLYCGYGCKNAMSQVMQLAEKIKAPVLYTMRSKEFVEPNNPYCVGMQGALATGSAHEALFDCDCLLMLGTDYPFDMALPTTPKIIQIDDDESHIGRRSKLDAAVVGDVAIAINNLLPLLERKENASFLKKSQNYAQDIDNKLNIELFAMKNAVPLRPEYLTHIISQSASDDAIFIVDVGLNDMWANRYIKTNKKRRILGSFKHGTMGAGIGSAIGIALLNPNQEIIWLAGDGNLTMFLGDLLTIKNNNLPIKIVVFNNQTLGFIDYEATQAHMKPFATALPNPDFADLAKAMGIKSISIDNPKDLQIKIAEAFAYAGPILINVQTDSSAWGV